MCRRLIFLFAVSVATPNPSSAQQAPRPDFSGRWIMDSTRSSRDGVLSSLTLSVRRSGDTLLVRSDGANAAGAFSTNSIFDLTGRATENNLRGIVLTTTAAWHGAILVLTSKGSANGRSMTLEDSWSVDATGSRLTRNESLSVDGQVRSESLTLQKAPPTAAQQGDRLLSGFASFSLPSLLTRRWCRSSALLRTTRTSQTFVDHVTPLPPSETSSTPEPGTCSPAI